MTEATLEERTARVREESAFVGPLLSEIERTIVGQDEMVRRIASSSITSRRSNTSKSS